MSDPANIATLQRCKQILKGELPCPFVASHRFTWPGRDESFICGECLPALEATASALGLNLTPVPLRSP
jgi:hypothetical protein